MQALAGLVSSCPLGSHHYYGHTISTSLSWPCGCLLSGYPPSALLPVPIWWDLQYRLHSSILLPLKVFLNRKSIFLVWLSRLFAVYCISALLCLADIYSPFWCPHYHCLCSLSVRCFVTVTCFILLLFGLMTSLLPHSSLAQMSFKSWSFPP